MNALQLKIPPPIYMAAFAGLMWLTAQYFPLLHLISTPWNLVGIGIIGLAILMDFWSLGLFFRARTTFNPIHPERSQTLVTSGPYQYTRNPMYVGMVVILSGWGIYLGALTPFLWIPVFTWTLTKQQILPEEKYLEEKFGDEYRFYKQKVSRWW